MDSKKNMSKDVIEAIRDSKKLIKRLKVFIKKLPMDEPNIKILNRMINNEGEFIGWARKQ